MTASYVQVATDGAGKKLATDEITEGANNVHLQRVVMTRLPTLVMETDVDAVTAGGSTHGWVSGSPASLAASASFIAIFDLGPNWAQYGLVQAVVLPQGPSTGLVAVEFGSPSGTTWQPARRLATAFNSAISTTYQSMPSSTGAQSCTLRPLSRYLLVRGTNGDATNALGATSKITVAAYPW